MNVRLYVLVPYDNVTSISISVIFHNQYITLDASRLPVTRNCIIKYSRLRLIGPLANRVLRLIGPNGWEKKWPD